MTCNVPAEVIVVIMEHTALGDFGNHSLSQLFFTAHSLYVMFTRSVALLFDPIVNIIIIIITSRIELQL